MSEEVTSADLQKLIAEEIQVLLKEEREKIIERAMKRLKKMEKSGEKLS